MHGPADKPSEQHHITEDYDRTYTRNRIAYLMPAVHKRDSEGQHHGGGNPNADLRQCSSATVDSRMKVIENSEEKKGHPAQQIEMSVRRHRRVILRYGHHYAPDHARQNQ
jgi:hypothetical protein